MKRTNEGQSGPRVRDPDRGAGSPTSSSMVSTKAAGDYGGVVTVPVNVYETGESPLRDLHSGLTEEGPVWVTPLSQIVRVSPSLVPEPLTKVVGVSPHSSLPDKHEEGVSTVNVPASRVTTTTSRMERPQTDSQGWGVTMSSFISTRRTSTTASWSSALQTPPSRGFVLAC